MKILPSDNHMFFYTGELSGAGLTTYYKTLKETANIYNNPDAVKDNEEVAYYVTSQLHNTPEDGEEALNWGITVIHPLTIDGECCMTRGHFHQEKDCGEYYYCLNGEGYLLCWDGENQYQAYYMIPSSLQYIPGGIAHRLINTGKSMFKVAACWANKAGNDYRSIEEKGFPVRCFKKGEKIKWVAVND